MWHNFLYLGKVSLQKTKKISDAGKEHLRHPPRSKTATVTHSLGLLESSHLPFEHCCTVTTVVREIPDKRDIHRKMINLWYH